MAVYFLKGEHSNMVKVGKTRDVVKRLRDLQSASGERLIVLAVMEDGIDDRPYHKQFAEHWSHGEWFQPAAVLMDFIKTIPPSQYDGLCIRVQNPGVAASDSSRFGAALIGLLPIAEQQKLPSWEVPLPKGLSFETVTLEDVTTLLQKIGRHPTTRQMNAVWSLFQHITRRDKAKAKELKECHKFKKSDPKCFN